MSNGDVKIYDTTLRDGCQAEQISFSVEDKLRVARRLIDLGVAYVEGGWPHETNPADLEFFQRARDLDWNQTKLAAFGSTRRKDTSAAEDSILHHLIESQAPVVTIFGKSWELHVTDVLGTSRDENLAMIEDSVAFVKSQGREVIFDAEHFFDGYKADPEYAMETLRAATRGGADWLVPCDTNGGTMPHELQQMMVAVAAEFELPLGIHVHNDTGMAVANSIIAVQAGATQVQGTVNGYGERAGNADLCTLVPNLELKLGRHCLPAGKLEEITALSLYVSEVANLSPNDRAPYVGASAFAHKGGMHVDAVLKQPGSFEHTNPETVGNERRLLVSDYAGRSTVLHKLQKLWPDLERDDPLVAEVLSAVKQREYEGYQYEAAEASLELLARRLRQELPELFELHGFRVIVDKAEHDAEPHAEATVRITVNGDHLHTAAEGDGPVHALDQALRKALLEKYPALADIHLTDYKVRVLDATRGTATSVRVLIEATDGEETWSTVAAHENIIEASWRALVDSIVYGLTRHLQDEADRTVNE